MKTKRFIVSIVSIAVIISAYGVERSLASENSFVTPSVNEFTVSHDSIDIAQPNAELFFTLKVSHPIGIVNDKTILWFTSRDKKIQLSTELVRQENSSKTEIKFVGRLKLGANLSPGIYDFYSEPIEGIANKSGLGSPKTDNIYPRNFNSFADAEKSVLVRLGGNLDLDSKTFVGPTYSSSISLTDGRPFEYSTKIPIFRVGEFYDPNDYFVKRVPNLLLKVNSSTPNTCINVGDVLKFIAVGNCSFEVYTLRNSDYLSTKINLNSQIDSARVKPAITLPTISNQTAIGLPKKLDLSLVYSTAGEIVVPKSITQTTCLPSGISSVLLISGGNCTISYQSQENSTYLASDIYLLNFEIVRTQQTLEFAPSSTVDLKSKTLTLSASASSGAAVTFTAEPSANCAATGTTLSLLMAGDCAVTAQQVGTTTIAPISKTVTISITGKPARELRTISCIKGSKKVSVTKAKPKCPKGYSRVR